MGVETTAEDLLRLRKAAGLTQSEAAALMGVAMRAYQDIEGGISKVRAIHVNALERGLLNLSAERGDLSFVPPSVMSTVLRVAGIAGLGPVPEGPDPALEALEARWASLLADLEPVEAALNAYRAAVADRS